MDILLEVNEFSSIFVLPANLILQVAYDSF